jgi:hypothetical protein
LENLHVRNLLEDLETDERMLKLDLKETGCEDVDWILLAQVGTSGGLL